jgi:protein-S-isoprenylcysteine O-methyltransferase Ste14
MSFGVSNLTLSLVAEGDKQIETGGFDLSPHSLVAEDDKRPEIGSFGPSRHFMIWNRFQYKKMRVLLAWIGGIFLFYFSRSNEDSFRIGVPCVLAGEAIRIWASGYIEKKGRKLAVDGPFAFVRNPLYIGNFLLGLGIVLIARNAWLAGVFLLGFTILYRGTIRREEAELAARFGEVYRRYCENVPRLIPRLTRWCGQERVSFQWRFVLKHHEYITFLGIAVLMAGQYLWEEVILEHDFGWKEGVAIGVVCSLAAVLIFERISRSQFEVS